MPCLHKSSSHFYVKSELDAIRLMERLQQHEVKCAQEEYKCASCGALLEALSPQSLNNNLICTKKLIKMT